MVTKISVSKIFYTDCDISDFFKLLDKTHKGDLDYGVIYCGTYKTGFRMGRVVYHVYQSEIIKKLNQPAENKVDCEGRMVRLMVFEEFYVTYDNGRCEMHFTK